MGARKPATGKGGPAKAPKDGKAPKSPKAPKAAKERMSLAEVMRELEKAGSEATRRTYARHGAKEPMFGVAFGTLGRLQKRIRVDHELAMALWGTGNFDARNLAFKIADPALMEPGDLDRWAHDTRVSMVSLYMSSLTVEGPHASAMAARWLAEKDESGRRAGWGVVGLMAMRDETLPDSWFAGHLSAIENGLASAPDLERGAMNAALIHIGCRSPGLRRAAVAAAGRIGRVEIDHGDTSCRTPDAAGAIEKAWTRSLSRGFPSPAAHERSMESMRTRC
jgi:3-methyladenine DNA glycosylase AlkD